MDTNEESSESPHYRQPINHADIIWTPIGKSEMGLTGVFALAKISPKCDKTPPRSRRSG